MKNDGDSARRHQVFRLCWLAAWMMVAHEAAARAYVIDKDVVMAIWAADPEVIVGHVPDHAEVVGAAPGRGFAGGRAAIFLPIAVGAAGNGVKLFQIEPFVAVGAMVFDLFVDALSIEIGAIGEDVFCFLEAMDLA